jgi:murein L,D-transpeptidase YafK
MPRLLHVLAALGCSVAGVLVALAWPAPAGGEEACRTPEIRVYKREGAVELLCEGAVRRTMAATFGSNPVGPKEQEGDQRTPEGTYRVASRVKSERFHRFLGISYPSDDDRRRAAEKGIEKLGGGIGIHGTRTRLAGAARLWTRLASAAGIAGVWGPTDGCIGVANEDVEVLFDSVPVGTRVVIAPARPATRR